MLVAKCFLKKYGYVRYNLSQDFNSVQFLVFLHQLWNPIGKHHMASKVNLHLFGVINRFRYCMIKNYMVLWDMFVK